MSGKSGLTGLNRAVRVNRAGEVNNTGGANRAVRVNRAGEVNRVVRVNRAGGVKRWLRLLSASSVVLATLSACAIPEDARPRAINPDVVPAGLRAPVRDIRVFFQKTGGLSFRQRAIALTPNTLDTARSAVAELRKGLTPVERGLGFTSDFARADREITVVEVNGGTVALDVSKAPGLIDNAYQLGQIVLTLTELPGIQSVDLVEGGRRVPQARNAQNEPIVPPLTADVYDLLIRQQSTAVMYFVRNGKLEPSDRAIEAPEVNDDPDRLAEKYLAPLLEGPTSDELASGYTSLLPAPTVLLCSDRRRGPCDRFLIDFGPDFDTLKPADQALAIAQVLFTVDGWPRPPIGDVQIQVSGVLRRSIPVPGGKTAIDKVSKTDYRSLLAPVSNAAPTTAEPSAETAP